MTDHTTEAKAPGKYDCHFDSWVHGELLTGEAGDGHVEAPTGWFVAVDLDTGHANHDESLAAEHYGSRWLIVKEDSRGFVGVFPFENEEQREIMLGLLVEQFNDWNDQDGDQL